MICLIDLTLFRCNTFLFRWVRGGAEPTLEPWPRSSCLTEGSSGKEHTKKRNKGDIRAEVWLDVFPISAPVIVLVHERCQLIELPVVIELPSIRTSCDCILVCVCTVGASKPAWTILGLWTNCPDNKRQLAEISVSLQVGNLSSMLLSAWCSKDEKNTTIVSSSWRLGSIVLCLWHHLTNTVKSFLKATPMGGHLVYSSHAPQSQLRYHALFIPTKLLS